MAKIKELHFKVAGITFDNPDGENRQTVMKRLARMLREEYDREDLFDNTTKKEQIEYEFDEISEFEGIEIPLSIHRATYDGKIALKLRTAAGDVGFIPAKLVDEVLRLPNALAYGEITGGRVRVLDIDEVTTETRTYGLNVTIETRIDS